MSSGKSTDRAIARQHARWMETCAYCPTLCLFTCPVSDAEGRDTVAPWGKMALARWLQRGRVPLDEESAAILYKCLGCLACRTICRHDVEVPAVLFAARADAVARGVRPFPADDFRPDAAAQAERLRAAVPAERYVDDAQVLLLPGPETIRRAPGVLGDTFAAADALGLDYLAVGEASALDCGWGLWSAGYVDEARAAAQRLTRATARYRRLVVSSPHTLYMLQVVYPQWGIEGGPPAVWLGELLAATVVGQSVPRLRKGRVALHDPCYLGRHQALYDAPRHILNAVCAEPALELRNHRESARCCGGGGGVDVTSPGVSSHAAGAVIDSARERQVEVLVTSCSTCAHLLGAASGEDGPEVKELVTVLAEALRA